MLIVQVIRKYHSRIVKMQVYYTQYVAWVGTSQEPRSLLAIFRRSRCETNVTELRWRHKEETRVWGPPSRISYSSRSCDPWRKALRRAGPGPHEAAVKGYLKISAAHAVHVSGHGSAGQAPIDGLAGVCIRSAVCAPGRCASVYVGPRSAEISHVKISVSGGWTGPAWTPKCSCTKTT